MLWASWRVTLYGLALWLFFHLMVVLVEEPHLRNTREVVYEDYCRITPRWFWRPKSSFRINVDRSRSRGRGTEGYCAEWKKRVGGKFAYRSFTVAAR